MVENSLVHLHIGFIDESDTGTYRAFMASLLYSLGRWSFVHRRRVAFGWLLALVTVGALAGTVSKGFQDSFTLPGSESQEALSTLQRTFPQLSGASVQMVVVAPVGSKVTDPALRASIRSALARIDKLPGVDSTISPFDDLIKGSVSKDGRSAIAQIQFAGGLGEIPSSQINAVVDQGRTLRADGTVVEFGGSAFTTVSGPPISVIEVAGVVLAFVFLLLALGAVLPATLPLVTSIFGVAVTLGAIVAATGSVTMSTTTPLLALMIGLAVGIDYALFVLWRHREELAEGTEPSEAAARAVATAGSSVVFAGLTVMIALAALVVVGIPFLAVMGIAAAGAVGISVLVTLTLLPALLGFAGSRLTPRRSRKASKSVARAWVRTVTRLPLVTLAVVVIGLGVVALPARELALGLPDNGVSPADTTQRKAYDLINANFGPGYNAPILVEADIIKSTDPLGLMKGLSADIAKVPGVALIALSTPNPNADTGVIQVIPTTGANDPATAELVRSLRHASREFKRDHGVVTSVTGQTALQIDVSDRLSSSLLPFGLLVVGLSLVLLMAVFRSILIPIKAAAGYLLSVAASFGVVVAVFQWGWLSGVFQVERLGPVVSFLPIILMGVLFGLAMDYEVFLVSRMKEEHSRSGDARAAIGRGFDSSSTVVAAAAAIMISVFVAFVPEGDASVKPIAFALAIGVFIDAFIVRMTLVPAVLRLFGDVAWTLPRRLDGLIPHVDVDGEGLRERLAQSDWPAVRETTLVAADELILAGHPEGRPGLTLRAPRGSWLLLTGHDRDVKRAMLLTLAARLPATSGRLRVADHLLPYEAKQARASVQLAEFSGINDLDEDATIAEHAAHAISSGTFHVWISPAHIDEVLESVNQARRSSVGIELRPLRAEDLLGSLSPLDRMLLSVALVLPSAPDIVIIPDVDDLRSAHHIQLFWAMLAGLLGPNGPGVIASITDDFDGPRDRQAVDYFPVPARIPDLEKVL